uniref:Glycosyltransferase family 92 protein n=1 Tax=Grammatophora oceanica TaxID=210454 RepID=A0A7S1UNB7_9STRA|mmetsp:Transcript_11638/g.17064  ORF Transcript_11638/g.17064 Transcript_11638/m.17064 type:complete len:429 (+) Transcript_11638:261-1547(+)|eukprot:CAMPEP_0194049764 /NCGR_PEP_ID=MMETSP0009_2-20130614/30879_1 /TAXON_ID=210454 /ORGANISM="Grammatophora oceanica, Strain CCMP 410" /LENGTH=428 /DNA_ID=CAMNT_0038695985 /DNA_START=231 /DNA_END=1520 /DNA_ORIENTATION=-
MMSLRKSKKDDEEVVVLLDDDSHNSNDDEEQEENDETHHHATSSSKWMTSRKRSVTVLLLLVIAIQVYALLMRRVVFLEECGDGGDIALKNKKQNNKSSSDWDHETATTPMIEDDEHETSSSSFVSGSLRLSPDIPSQPQTTAKVGLCAITKHSSQYLDEWMDYNLLAIGFYEVYLYDNSDEFVLQEWKNRRHKKKMNSTADHHDANKRIHVTHYPGKYTQIPSYKNCTETFGHRVDYLAYFDDDEFLVLYKHRTVGDFVLEHLVNGSSLTVNWQYFGNANHTIASPLPVTKRFQHTVSTFPGTGVKSIVRPQDFLGMKHPHAIYLQPKSDPPRAAWRDTTRQIANYTDDGAQNWNKPSDVALLYHYKYKSEQEWLYKSCIRQDIGNRQDWNCDQRPEVGYIKDDTAWRILSERVPKYQMFEEFPDYG